MYLATKEMIMGKGVCTFIEYEDLSPKLKEIKLQCANNYGIEVDFWEMISGKSPGGIATPKDKTIDLDKDGFKHLSVEQVFDHEILHFCQDFAPFRRLTTEIKSMDARIGQHFKKLWSRKLISVFMPIISKQAFDYEMTINAMLPYNHPEGLDHRLARKFKKARRQCLDMLKKRHVASR
jgi:hypothetical protein